MSKSDVDLFEVIETADAGDTNFVVAGKQTSHPPLSDNRWLAQRSREALDMVDKGSRRVAKYEALLNRLVGEIGHFAEAARRERAQLENQVRSLQQELAELRTEHATTEKSLIDSQLDCWMLRMRVQTMKDARTIFDNHATEQRTGTMNHVIDAD